MTPLGRWAFSLVATGVAVLMSYQWLDRPIALFFQVQQSETIAQLGRLPNPIVLVAVITFIAIGLWHLSGRLLSRLQKCALLCSLSLIMAEATKAQLKFAFGRTWPATWIHNNPSFLRDGVYGFNFFHGGTAYESFPSGHMAATCAVISVLWIYYPKWRTLYVFAVLAIAAGLVGGNYHFLSDVIAGGFIGLSTGWMATSLWKAHEEFNGQSES